MELGTPVNPIMFAEDNYANKYCKCFECGVIAKCTPLFDFYKGNFPGLRCEACLLSKHLA